MLFCVDIGNTETTSGIFSNDNLIRTYRMETKLSETADEVAVDVSGLLNLGDLKFSDIDGACLSSVVPRCTTAYTEMIERYFKVKPLVVGPGVKTGIPIDYDNPHEVGADRIANAVAVKKRYGCPAVVVDFGTATTIDVISSKGEYIGGTISPGILVSSEALFEKAARLSKVELERPAGVIGKNTGESLQSGILYGTAGMVDSLISLIEKELKTKPVSVATGGLSTLFKGISRKIEIYEPFLTLFGLCEIFEINKYNNK